MFCKKHPSGETGKECEQILTLKKYGLLREEEFGRRFPPIAKSDYYLPHIRLSFRMENSAHTKQSFMKLDI
jgi:hypothetical protein